MLDAEQPTVMEGTPEEIASFIKALPPTRYHVEIVGISDSGSTKNYLAEAVERAVSRTPEDVLATRDAILKSSPAPRQIPAGLSFEDVVSGQWPGQETDEEIEAALKRLS
jgi:hypothetical protein